MQGDSFAGCFSQPRRAARARRLPLTLRIGLATLVLCLLTVAPSALAARGHVLAGTHIGEPCTEEPCGPGQLKEPDGVAVNEASGDVYVVDKANNRVQRFSSAGAFLGQFDGSATYEDLTAEEKVKATTAAGEGGQPGETPTGAFKEPEAIAIDNACALHKPEPLTGEACAASDPSNGDVYVLDTGHEVVDKFAADGSYVGQVTFVREIVDLKGIAVDATGQLWVSEESRGGPCTPPGFLSHCVLNFSNAATNTLGSHRILEDNKSLAAGLSVDRAENLYALVFDNGSQADFVDEFDRAGRALRTLRDGSAIDPEPASGVAVDQSNNDVYIDNFTAVAHYTPSGGLAERLSVPGEHGSGLAVSAGGETVYAADSVANVVDVYAPEPPGAPIVAVSGGSVSAVSADSATFAATINPHGAASAFHFEYGRCESGSSCASDGYETSVPSPDGPVGSDFEQHAVSASVSGLQPASVYHFRVVAHNAIGGLPGTVGDEVVFATQGAGEPFALPDGRAWEQVSPPDKRGAALVSLTAPGLIQASSDGSALGFLANAPTEPGTPGNANGVQVLSKRTGSSWVPHDVAVPHRGATGASTSGGEYQFFSADLSQSVVEPIGEFEPALSPQASGRTPYLHPLVCARECFRPLVTAKPGFENVPAGTKLGGLSFAGATPDASHVILDSGVALQEGAGPGIYEWTGGHLAFIGPVGNGTTTGFHSISDDGSRVVFAGPAGNKEALQLRDTTTGHTLQLDAQQCPSEEEECQGAGGQFQGASVDGRRIFFTDHNKLTSVSGPDDLYECEIEYAEDVPNCRLTDLTPLSSGQNGAVVGHVLGMSQDGTSLYFVGNGVLATGAKPGACDTGAANATCNLYLLHAGAAGWEAAKLIAGLTQRDEPDWLTDLEQHPARVSPDGQWLAFMSQESLPAAGGRRYDNRDVTTGKPDAEVYLYHATDGSLRCASCDPTGARPAGRVAPSSNTALFNGKNVWPELQGVAATVPGWTTYSLGKSLYQSRYLSDTGRLFFNSSDGLVPQDVNSNWDVYQYEPPRVGGCEESSPTFSERSEGCVGLISAGTSPEESVFLDASATGGRDGEGHEGGGNVFFMTSSKLNPQDFDTSRDIYDAHECSTLGAPCFAPAAEVPPPCDTGDACKPAPSPQPNIFAAPASATFTGGGNPIAPITPPRAKAKPLTRAQKLAKALKACHKQHNKHKRLTCEKQARKRYGRKSSSQRRHK